MTNEEKAKRYDEVIKLVNSKWHYKNQPCIIDVSEIFPELNESEDERIRKEILGVINQIDENTTICGRNYDYKKWIAWLKKQGEKKPVWSEEDELMRKEAISIIKQYDIICEREGDKCYTADRVIAWLEKQGEEGGEK